MSDDYLRPPQSAARASGVRIFENPANGYRESVRSLDILWALLFGWFFFGVRGLWQHIGIQLGIAALLLLAFGGPGVVLVLVVWIVYAFFVPSLSARRYLRMGWREVQ